MAEVTRRRRICPECKQRTTFTIYPNRCEIPQCGCDYYVFTGKPPYTQYRLNSVPNAADILYFWHGPGRREIEAMNAGEILPIQLGEKPT